MIEPPPIERFPGESTHAYAARYVEWTDRVQMFRLGLAWVCTDCCGVNDFSPLRHRVSKCAFCLGTGLATMRRAAHGGQWSISLLEDIRHELLSTNRFPTIAVADTPPLKGGPVT